LLEIVLVIIMPRHLVMPLALKLVTLVRKKGILPAIVPRLEITMSALQEPRHAIIAKRTGISHEIVQRVQNIRTEMEHLRVPRHAILVRKKAILREIVPKARKFLQHAQKHATLARKQDTSQGIVLMLTSSATVSGLPKSRHAIIVKKKDTLREIVLQVCLRSLTQTFLVLET